MGGMSNTYTLIDRSDMTTEGVSVVTFMRFTQTYTVVSHANGWDLVIMPNGQHRSWDSLPDSLANEMNDWFALVM